MQLLFHLRHAYHEPCNRSTGKVNEEERLETKDVSKES